jgi:hypothetical protein
VLLLGETGTGKELLAHAIHAASSRASGPFVSVNIAAVPDTLLEAEFFGVAPGAYTGADRKGRDGKFKLADGGTLFLDEIGDMPQSLQAKLLRALQEGEIEPLGSNKLVPFDVRVIAATSRDLGALVREGGSAKTCFTACMCCRSACRRCASGAATSRRWSRCWAKTWPCATARRRPSWPPTPGPAGGPALARQHPRAAQRAGAGGHAQRRQHHRRRQLARVLREAGVEPAAPARCRTRARAAGREARYLRPLAEQVAELERAPSPPRWQATWRQQAGRGAAAGHLARHLVRASGKP